MSSELNQHFQTSEVMCWFVYQWHHNFTSQHAKQHHDIIFFITGPTRFEVLAKLWTVTRSGIFFPDRGCQSGREECQPIIWQNFCWQVHEIESNWSEKGASVLSAPLNPPVLSYNIIRLTLQIWWCIESDFSGYCGGLTYPVMYYFSTKAFIALPCREIG